MVFPWFSLIFQWFSQPVYHIPMNMGKKRARNQILAIESSPSAARDERHIHIAHEGPLGASREQGVALVVEVIFASAYHGKNT